MAGCHVQPRTIENAEADLVAQADRATNADGLLQRYPKAQARDFDGDAQHHRDGCAHRLSPDARHAGRFLDLQGRTVEVMAMSTYDTLAALRRQLGPSRHGRLLRRHGPLRVPARAPRPATTRPRRSPSRTIRGLRPMATNIEKDEITGTPTTGHEWDGIKELNTPLPRWWLWTFYATHRSGPRLHRRLSGLAAAHRGHAGPPRLFSSRADVAESIDAGKAAQKATARQDRRR